MMRGFCPWGLCPEGAYVLMELCMEGVFVQGGFLRGGLFHTGCCPGFVAYTTARVRRIFGVHAWMCSYMCACN